MSTCLKYKKVKKSHMRYYRIIFEIMRARKKNQKIKIKKIKKNLLPAYVYEKRT